MKRASLFWPCAMAATVFATFGCNGSPNGPNGKATSGSTANNNTPPPPPNPPAPPNSGTNPGKNPGTTPGSTSNASFAAGPAMAVPRGLHTATLLNDGRVLIAGGIDAQKTTAGFVVEHEIFDPTTNTFTKTSDPSLGGNPGGYTAILDPKGAGWPVPRAFHTATLLGNGTVLIAGGYGMETWDATGAPQQTDLKTAFIFDPKTNSFAQTGSLIAARQMHYAVLLSNGQVLIAGGVDSTLNGNQGGTLDTGELYNPTAGTFTALPAGTTMTVPRDSGGAVATPTGALFAAGEAIAVPTGATAPVPMLAPGGETFDPTTGTFAALAATGPIDRALCTLDVTSKGYVLAGGLGVSGAVLEVELLDTGLAAWTTIAKLPGGRAHHASAALDTGVLLVGGATPGAGGAITTLDTGDFVDVVAKTVSTAKMAQGRNSSAATRLKNNTILVSGGFTGGTKDPLGLDGTSIPKAEIFSNSAPAPAPTPAPPTP